MPREKRESEFFNGSRMEFGSEPLETRIRRHLAHGTKNPVRSEEFNHPSSVTEELVM